MRKDFRYIFSSPLVRFSAYITTFVAISVSTEVLRSFVANPRSDLSIMLFLATLAIFIISGTIFISERNILSRITSFSVMLMLVAITVAYDSPAMPDSLPLALMLAVSYFGAKRFLHQKPPSKRRLIFYSASIIAFAVAFAVAFVCTSIILARISFYNNPSL
jgi:uncharacterized membrane protein